MFTTRNAGFILKKTYRVCFSNQFKRSPCQADPVTVTFITLEAHGAQSLFTM